jgi:hypothetical protein
VWTAGVLALVCLSGSVALSVAAERARPEVNLQEMMYISSPSALKKLSLGYEGLLADIYWTRALVYFGEKHHRHEMTYKLIEPILTVTTTLDPQMLVAYNSGSVFLAQRPPQGAGDPEAAARLVRRGIAANPKAWKLWYQLGYVQWQEMGDAKAASQSFLTGSKMPGAMPWMAVMAAALAGNAGEIETARYLWTNIYQGTQEKYQRETASHYLMALDAYDEMVQIQHRVELYGERTGHAPASFGELIAAGYLRGVPLDPLGAPYRLRNGRVEMDDDELKPYVQRGIPQIGVAKAADGSGH